MEIGGYFGLEQYRLPMMHENAIALNCARQGLAYLIEAKKITSIAIPRYICNTVIDVCRNYKIDVSFYPIDNNFRPNINGIADNTWIYVVNYFGQISNEYILKIREKHSKLIIDNVQAYFQSPIIDLDTIYSCRKFVGVPDGAFLYTNSKLERKIKQDCSVDRMSHILGRYEKGASKYYHAYLENEDFINKSALMKMSELTTNLLHAVDYVFVKKCREENFELLHSALSHKNKLDLMIPDGPFMYPLFIENGNYVRQKLKEKSIFIPMLWPEILENSDTKSLEYEMTMNILPLPIDQRYTQEHMKIILNELNKLLFI